MKAIPLSQYLFLGPLILCAVCTLAEKTLPTLLLLFDIANGSVSGGIGQV